MSKDITAPWKIRGYAGEHEEAGAYIEDKNGEHVASTAHLKRRNNRREWKEYHAKAQLIAAAPDLLEACEALMKFAGVIEERSGDYETGLARQAITKAKGTS